VKPTAEPTNAGGGEEETKEGGEATPKADVIGVFKALGVNVELIQDENGRSVDLNGASLQDVAKAFKLFQTQIEMLTEARVKK